MIELKATLLAEAIKPVKFKSDFQRIVNQTAGCRPGTQCSKSIKFASHSATFLCYDDQVNSRLVLKDRPQQLVFVPLAFVDMRNHHPAGPQDASNYPQHPKPEEHQEEARTDR